MESADTTPRGTSSSGHETRQEKMIRFRLYIARSTPNSVRAERNLLTVLDELKRSLVYSELEIVDVFAQPKRALVDGVVVTPSLLVLWSDKRVVLLGDLGDRSELIAVIQSIPV